MAAFPARQADSPALSKAASDFVILCHILGIPRKESKDEMGTDVVLLGRRVNTSNFMVSVPQAKLEKILRSTSTAMYKKSLSLQEAQSLAGLLSFCAPAVQLGVIFCRRLWTFVATYNADWPVHYRRRIPTPVLDDIRWWHTLFPLYNGIKFFDESSRPLVHLFADASEHGLGAFFFDSVQDRNCDWREHIGSISREHALMIAAPPSKPDVPLDINVLEILPSKWHS